MSSSVPGTKVIIVLRRACLPKSFFLNRYGRLVCWEHRLTVCITAEIQKRVAKVLALLTITQNHLRYSILLKFSFLYDVLVVYYR
jgi:hypothetical protein